jgi:hypothetical protein
LLAPSDQFARDVSEVLRENVGVAGGPNQRAQGKGPYLAVEAKRMGSPAWPWVLGGVAVLFNPIVPMRMHRSDWQIVDSFAATTLIVFATLYKPRGYSKP